MKIIDKNPGHLFDQEYEVIVCTFNNHVVIRSQEQSKGFVFPPMCADRWNQDMYTRFWVVRRSPLEEKTLLDAGFKLLDEDGKLIE